MKSTMVKKLLRELKKMPIIDPHTHLRADQPVAKHLGDLLGYHYYTELSNSSRGHPEKLPDDPDARIDYVWIDESTRVERTGLAFDYPVQNRFLSDHFGLIADLWLTTPQ